MSKRTLKVTPLGTSRQFWHGYYVDRFNKTGAWQAEQLAIWYLLLYLAFGDEKY